MDLKVYALLNAKIKELTGESVDLSKYYTKEEADAAIAAKVAEIVADAPEDFDTLKEMSDWISQHEDSAVTMNSAIQQNTTDISDLESGKVDKVDGKSLISDTEIERLAGVKNYDDTCVKTDISTLNTNKVDKVDGKSLISDSEITRLASVDNYDDTTIKQRVTTNETNISTRKKHIVGEFTDSDFSEDSNAVMTKTVPTGMADYAAIKKIGGRTQKMVQLVSEDLASVHNVTLDSSSSKYSYAIAYRKGHVYMMSAKSNAYPIRFQVDSKYGICKIEVDSNVRYLTKFTCNYPDFSSGAFIYNTSSSSYAVTGNFLIFDLTEMGIPDITEADFRAMFPEEYYAYTEGELWNAPVESVVSVSKNLFSVPLIPKGYINASNGLYGTSVNWSATYDFINISPNTTYTISNITITGSLAGTAFYDKNKNYISGTNLYTFTTPSNAKYMRTCTNSETDIHNVQLEKGSVTTEYSPYYNKTTLSIPEVIKNLPDYGVEGNVVDFENGTYTHTNTITDGEVVALSTAETIDITDILHPIRCEAGGTITFNNEHSLDMPNTVVYKKEVSLS